MTLLIIAYNLALILVACLLWPIWLPLVLSKEKYRSTFFQRLYLDKIRPDGSGAFPDRQRIWIHALSVGEVLSAEPLVKSLHDLHGARDLIFTASTQTGIETARRVIAPYVAEVRHFPYDTIFSVKKAILAINPKKAIIVETDIWPNFLTQLKSHDIPVYLVNARISYRSFRGYRRIRFLMTPLLSIFRRICVQTDLDIQRFNRLGVSQDRMAIVGNIKFDQAPLNISGNDIKKLSERLALNPDSPVWVAGSTHEGEEEALLNAYRKIRAAGMPPTLVIAPRNPARAGDVCRIFRTAGIDALPMTQTAHRKQRATVVVIDRIGVLRQLYALADVTFVGGSLVEEGGHNPLEPAAVAKPILFGPHTDDFRWICQVLENAGGAYRVHDANQISREVSRLLNQPHERRRMGKLAFDVFAKNRGAVKRTLSIIESEQHE